MDCGGPCSNACPTGTACTGSDGNADDSVCTTGICDQLTRRCTAPTCADGRLSTSLGETGVVRAPSHSDGALECGGSCARCPVGAQYRCNRDTDCESLNCQLDAGVGSSSVLATSGFCAAPSCSNSKKDGQETDWNCGGPTCNECADGRICEVPSDCIGDCVAGRCQGSGGTGLSCGFGTSSLCQTGDSCEANSHLDCASGFCRGEDLANGTTVRRCAVAPVIINPPATGGGTGNGGSGGGGSTPTEPTCPLGGNTCGGICTPCPVGTSGCIRHADCNGLCLNGVCSAEVTAPVIPKKTAGQSCRRHSECGSNFCHPDDL